MHDSGKIKNYNEISILVRSKYNKTAKDLIWLFDLNNIPYNNRCIPDLFNKPEIKSILTLFYHIVPDKEYYNRKLEIWKSKWLNINAFTGKYFHQVLFNLSDDTKNILNTHKVRKFFHQRGQRLEEGSTESFEKVKKPILTDENLIKFGVTNKDDLDFFRRLNKLKKYIASKNYQDSEDTISDILEILLIDVCNYLTDDNINNVDYQRELENLEIIRNIFHNYELIVDKKDLKGVFHFLISNIEDYFSNNNVNEGIQLMTVHKSKGLEFPVVILLSLEKNKFPGEFKERGERIDRIRFRKGFNVIKKLYPTPYSFLEYKNFNSKEEEISEYNQEEERIVYVAMTRAQDTLILSNLINIFPKFEFNEELKKELSELEKKDIIKEMPKGPLKIENLINNNLNDFKYLLDDFTIIPETVCEKPPIKKRED